MIEAALALLLVAASHAVRLRYGLNLSDEGFLWNGALRIGQGKIPIRDYKSYDPGRFYWVWAWMHLFGRGLFGMRHSVAVFQALGLWAGLTALATGTDNIAALALAGAILVLWMVPRHKLFEHAYSLIAVLAITLLIQAPSNHTALLTGVIVGFAGIIGRNHAVYCIAASVLAILVLTLKGVVDQPTSLAALWGIGIVIGYAPMLAMFVFVRGLWQSYLNDKVLALFRRRSVNLSLPTPWPWRQRYAGLTPLNRVSRFVTSLHFVVLPVFYAVTLAWIVLSPQGLDNTCLVASCFVGVFYLHHASGRSDVPHLCQVTQPFLTALFALAFGSANPALVWLTLPLLLPIGWLIVRQIDARLQWIEKPELFAKVDVLGDRVVAPRNVANQIIPIRELISQHLEPSDRLFIAPLGALLYPLLKRETPIHSDFLHFPETEANQDMIIADLETNHVDWALVENTPLDQRDELMFRNTHASVWTYLEGHFDPVQTGGLNKRWSFWHRKPGAPDG